MPSQLNPGDLVTYLTKELRVNASPVMARRVALVQEVVTVGEEEPLVVMKPLCVLVYVYGYPEHGRCLPMEKVCVAALSEVSPLF